MKELLDLICYSYDGDEMYTEFEMLYNAFRYVNPKSNSKCEKQAENNCDVQIYIYIYVCVYMTYILLEMNKIRIK